MLESLTERRITPKPTAKIDKYGGQKESTQLKRVFEDQLNRILLKEHDLNG